MKTFSIYKLADGLFTGQRFSLAPFDKARAESNVPSGCGMIEGEYDHLSQCVDISTGKVIEYQPPKPSENSVWNDKTRRWEKHPLVADAVRRAEQARQSIAELEVSQRRPLRELALDPSNFLAKERLLGINAQIEEQRKYLSKAIDNAGD